MADKKISALTGATTPLAGTEVLPIVQSGATVKVAVSDLTAGRAISATAVTATTGNFVVGTSGQGIDFSATPNTGTSELLADYEEGTWTGTMTGGTTAPTTPVTATGYYTKIGNSVTVSIIFVNKDTTGALGQLLVTGLPYTAKSGLNQIGSVTSFGLSIPNKTLDTFIGGGGTSIEFVSAADNASWSFPNITAGAGKYLYITTTYLV
tara:strand:+ start:67 stop:690 length:624 start_codon:yes stop_codon:yes gene_type:complete